MAASVPSQPVDSLNCPACGYNDLTGRGTCAGTVKVTVTDKDGNETEVMTTCGHDLPVVV